MWFNVLIKCEQPLELIYTIYRQFTCVIIDGVMCCPRATILFANKNHPAINNQDGSKKRMIFLSRAFFVKFDPQVWCVFHVHTITGIRLDSHNAKLSQNKFWMTSLKVSFSQSKNIVFQMTYKLLSFYLGRFLKKLADDQCSSITKSSILDCHYQTLYNAFTMHGGWAEIGRFNGKYLHVLCLIFAHIICVCTL